MWPQSALEPFAPAMASVLREVAALAKQANTEAGRNFAMIGQIPCELRRWFRDHFDLRQEILTSAVTASDVFPMPPRVIGNR